MCEYRKIPDRIGNCCSHLLFGRILRRIFLNQAVWEEGMTLFVFWLRFFSAFIKLLNTVLFHSQQDVSIFLPKVNCSQLWVEVYETNTYCNRTKGRKNIHGYQACKETVIQSWGRVKGGPAHISHTSKSKNDATKNEIKKFYGSCITKAKKFIVHEVFNFIFLQIMKIKNTLFHITQKSLLSSIFKYFIWLYIRSTNDKFQNLDTQQLTLM